MSQHIKKISEETLGENSRWSYKHDVYEFPNGQKGDYYYGENYGGAIVIPILDDGRIVMVRQYRYLQEKSGLEFPGGTMEKNETAQSTIEREMQEETGYQSTDYLKIGSFVSLKGNFKGTTHLFIADELTKVGVPTLDITEDIEVVYRRLDELETMIKHNEIWDGETLASWALAREEVAKKIYAKQS